MGGAENDRAVFAAAETRVTATFDIVVPTLGRPSLGRLLEALSSGSGPRPGRIFVVDDRRAPHGPLAGVEQHDVTVLRGPAQGPAAARNVGWRAVLLPSWDALLAEVAR
jgi:hypothetical protein